MADTRENDSVLSQLQSKEQVELLDAIDQLRSDGLDCELDLPQLIVCGDRSSGKSSVLEAISGVRFPVKDLFCTTFASELKLRSVAHDSEARISVRIQPASYRSEDEKANLQQFQPVEGLAKLEDLPSFIEAVDDHLKQLDRDRNIFEDKLMVDIRMPGLPNLTLVDLPGLIHTSNKDQGQKDIGTVRSLVESYMADSSSIILAVLAADNNFANQIVMELARNIDGGGTRTLGVITKPDNVPRGSGSESCAVQYARNRHVQLELGWHVLKNRDHENRNVMPEERDHQEAQYFEDSIAWKDLAKEDCGAAALRRKLSHILLRAIGRNLPSVVRHIKSEISINQTIADQLGEPMHTQIEQRTELREISKRVGDLINAALQGESLDEFFCHPNRETASERRLGAQLMKTLEDFRDHMEARGHLYAEHPDCTPSDRNELVDFSSRRPVPDVMSSPEPVSTKGLVDGISRICREDRGYGVPGVIHKQVIIKIFRAQSSRWESIAHHFLRQCWAQARLFFTQAVEASAPSHLASKILKEIATSSFDPIETKLIEKLKELLRPYRTGLMITLNTSALSPAPDQTKGQDSRPYSFDVQGSSSQAPSPRDAQSQILSVCGEDLGAYKIKDIVALYYNNAMRVFTENVATLVVENCLITDLDKIFTSKTIDEMAPDFVQALASEPDSVLNKREANKVRMRRLKKALAVCNQHAHSLGPRDQYHHSEQLPPVQQSHDRVDVAAIEGALAVDPEPYLYNAATKQTDTLTAQHFSGYPTPPKTPASHKEKVSAQQSGSDLSRPSSRSSTHQSDQRSGSIKDVVRRRHINSPTRVGLAQLAPVGSSMQDMCSEDEEL